MKTTREEFRLGVAIVVAAWGLWMLISMSGQPDPSVYSVLCNSATSDGAGANWKVAIYLDVDACISCTEDMETWKQLERELPDYGGVLTFWSPAKDSLDVAVAMELEGFSTPVRVIDDAKLADLNWLNSQTPIKVLLDSNCQLRRIIMPIYDLAGSRQLIHELLAEVRSENRERL